MTDAVRGWLAAKTSAGQARRASPSSMRRLASSLICRASRIESAKPDRSHGNFRVEIAMISPSGN